MRRQLQPQSNQVRIYQLIIILPYILFCKQYCFCHNPFTQILTFEGVMDILLLARLSQVQDLLSQIINQRAIFCFQKTICIDLKIKRLNEISSK